MANDIIDINVYETTETVAITVNPNLTTVNINQVTSSGGDTNLEYTPSPTNGIVTSSTGTDATIPLADGTNAGLLTAAEKTKIANSVPYTGAVSDVNLGEFGIQLGNLEFDNTPTNIPTAAGSMYYNDTDGTLDLKLKGGNVTLQIGQEQVVRVVNKTATNIDLLESNYQAIRITGAQGQRIKVDLAQATNDVLSSETIGLVTETIANNAEGFVTTSGLIRGINTTGSLQSETWADGDILYLSPTVAGRVTKVKPTAPNHLIIIGYVIHAHITQGTIFVKVDNGYELDELHNVKITSAANNNVLAYTSATDIWENKSMGLQEVTNVGASTSNPIVVNATGVSTGVSAASVNGIGVNGISVNGIGVEGYSSTGIGVQGYSETSVGGNFDTDAVSANIANFRKGGVIKAAVQNNGKITATAGTVSTDVIVKSQLDTKQDAITLTTTGTSGAATLTGATLNIPQYSGATNLGYTASPTNGLVTSSTGTSATLTLADGTNAGLFTPAEKTKLSGIATGATVGVVPNAAITGATNTKITYDSKGLVTAGTSLIATDIPTITQAQVTNLTTDLAAKAPLASPAFTGNPTAPTQSALNNSTRLATTAYVEAACAVVSGASGVQVSSQEVTYTTSKIATVTAAEYAALTKDANTLYFITA